MQSVAPFVENTRFYTISTAGHVDHGKTSLLRALTGIDPDRLKEEKERQMTTDLGFAHLRLKPDLVAGFVDVPGHGRFLKNMLAGVGGLDMALLVVAADEGPMPQTEQHVRILSLLGVQHVLAVITKIDTCDQEQRALCLEQTEVLIAEHGMQMMAACSVSSTKGTGIDELKETLTRVLSELPRRSNEGNAFLPVDRVFSKQGFGTVVTGTLVRGQLAVGDNISLAPNAVPGRVRRLETFGASVERVSAGQRVACNIVLREQKDIVRGCVVSGEPLEGARSLLVSIVDAPRTGKEGLVETLADQPVRFYHGTAECHGRVRWVEAGASPQQVMAFVALADPVAAQPQDRFVIRLADDAIYGGTILMCDKPRWLNRNNSVDLARGLLALDYKAAVLLALDACPQSMVRVVLTESFLPSQAAPLALAELVAEKRLVRLGDNLMKTEVRASLAEQAVKLAAGDGSDQEISLEKLRLSLKPRLDRPTFALLVDEEVGGGKLQRKGDRVQVAGAGAVSAVSDVEMRAREAAIAIAGQQLCLEATEVLAKLKEQGVAGSAVVDALVKAGQLVRVDREFLSTPDNLLKAHRVLADIWSTKHNITPGDFREGAGTTRKYAMALLSYFDDRSITRRLNDGRVLLKPPPPPGEQTPAS